MGTSGIQSLGSAGKQHSVAVRRKPRPGNECPSLAVKGVNDLCIWGDQLSGPDWQSKDW